VQLAQNFFPSLSVIRYVVEVQVIERQAAGLQPLVVAADAILVDHCLGLGARHRPLLGSRAGLLEGEGGGKDYENAARYEQKRSHRGNLNLLKGYTGRLS